MKRKKNENVNKNQKIIKEKWEIKCINWKKGENLVVNKNCGDKANLMDKS